MTTARSLTKTCSPNAITYIQRTQCRPPQALQLPLQSLSESPYTLLSRLWDHALPVSSTPLALTVSCSALSWLFHSLFSSLFGLLFYWGYFNLLIVHFAVFPNLKHIWRFYYVFNCYEVFSDCISWPILTTKVSSSILHSYLLLPLLSCYWIQY